MGNRRRRSTQPLRVRMDQPNSRVKSDSRQVVDGTKTLLFWLLSSLLVLAPLSLAPETGLNQTQLKLVRIGILGMVFWLGLRWVRMPNFSSLSGSFLMLAIVFASGSLWSDNVIRALAYKGLFLVMVIAGIALAETIRNKSELKQFLFAAVCWSGVFVILVALSFVGDGAEMRKGRLVVWGLNPNQLGQTLAVMAMVNVFYAGASTGTKRALGIILALMCGYIVVLTGSRGALTITVLSVFGVTALKFFKIGAPVARLGMVVILVVICSFTVSSIKDDNFLISDRSEISADINDLRLFSDMSKNTRGGIWRGAWRKFLENPIFGNGWNMTSSGGWATYQSAYLQILVETGLLGVAVLLNFLIRCLVNIPQAFRQSSVISILAVVAISLLVHGAFESALLAGVTVNGALLSFSLSVIGRQKVRR